MMNLVGTRRYQVWNLMVKFKFKTEIVLGYLNKFRIALSFKFTNIKDLTFN